MFRGIFQIITSGIVAGFFLAAAPAAAATRIWDGGGADNNWMNAANWNNNVAPVSGDDLLFPAGVIDTVTVNNFPAGTKFGAIAFNGPYTVDGNRILIGGTIAHLGPGVVRFNTNITLEGGPSAVGTITVRVEDLGSSIRIDGVIDGSGAPTSATLRKNGAGLLELFGNNQYGGVTAIEEGELRIHLFSALGTAGANTIVSDGAVLAIDLIGNSFVPEPLLLAGQGTAAADDGALMFLTQATLTGTVTLFGAATPRIVVATAANASIAGAIGGDNGLIKSGQGPLAFNANNTYTGMTTVAAGSLALGHAQALSSPSAGTTVLAGGSLNMLVPTIANEPLFAQANGSGIPVIQCAGPATCTWGGPIVVQGDNRFYSGTGNTLRLIGDISGTGAVSFGGSNGAAELWGNNTYAGKTVVSDLKLIGGHAIPDGTHLQMFVNATLQLTNLETIGALTGDEDDTIMLGNATLTIDTSDAWPKYTGTISGGGGLIKKGTGTFTIDRAQLYGGTTTVEAGVFQMLSNTVLPGPVNVSGGVLRGVATIGHLAVTGGRIEPGLSPGILTATSAGLAGGTLALELNGPTAGTQHDQVRVTTGSVALNNVTLELSAASVDAFSTPLVIVRNDGPNAVIGIFAGLPEGAIAQPSNGRALRITYAGGDGNDIVLTPAEASYYLSEGATGPFFDTDILIANPSATAVDASLTFLLSDGTTKLETRNIPGRSRVTVKVDDIAGLESTSVSTIVTSPSGLPLIVERTMRWDASGYGAHTEKAVTSTSRHWYFAGRRAGLLLDLSAARESAAVAERRDRPLPARERGGDRAHLSGRREFTLHGRRERRSGAGGIVLRHARRVRSAWRGGTLDVFRCRSPLEGRSRVGRRDRAVAHLVPRGRRDRAVLRDVRAARESRRSTRGSHRDVPAGHRRAGREDRPDSRAGAAHVEHRSGRSVAGQRRGGDTGERDAADSRRARPVLARSRAAVVRSAQQLRPSRRNRRRRRRGARDPRRLRQLGGDRPVLEEVGAVVEHAAQFAGGHDVLRERHGGEEAVVIPDEVREARLLACGDHFLALLTVEGEGLFAEDHLAILDALQGDLGVRVVRGADVDGVDVGARDQLAPVGLVGGVAPLSAEVLDLGFVAAADGLADDVVAGGQLVLREEVTDLRVGVGVGAAHEAVTDETDANGFRHMI